MLATWILAVCFTSVIIWSLFISWRCCSSMLSSIFLCCILTTLHTPSDAAVVLCLIYLVILCKFWLLISWPVDECPRCASCIQVRQPRSIVTFSFLFSCFFRWLVKCSTLLILSNFEWLFANTCVLYAIHPSITPHINHPLVLATHCTVFCHCLVSGFSLRHCGVVCHGKGRFGVGTLFLDLEIFPLKML